MAGEAMENSSAAARAARLARTTCLLARSLENLSTELEHDLRALLRAAACQGPEPGEPQADALRAENQQLKEALEGRGIIERAKGMLMILHDCDEETAFRMLVRLSQQRQQKVRHAAADVVAAAAEARLNGAPPRAVTRLPWLEPGVAP